MKRRRFLQGLGGITVGLPVLSKFAADHAHAAGDPNGPQRVITMAYAMGTHVPFFRPTATGSNFDFGSMTASMEPFKDRTLVVSSTPNSVLNLVNDYIYGHPGKKESVFTGTLMRHAFGGDGTNHADNVIQSSPDGHFRTANGPSIEHVIGQFLADDSHMLPSVDLGISPGRRVDGNVDSDFFYEAAENPVTLQANPGLAFASLFSGVTPGGEVDEGFLTLQRRRKSVLDAVRDSFVDLRQGLAPADRAVLDDHADKIRDIELDVAPPVACTIPDAPAEEESAYQDWSMGDFADLQIRLMAHAMACGVAPVGRLEFYEQQDPFFGIPLVDDAVATVQDWHHPVVHASDGWAKDGDVRVTGLRFFVEKFAQLCAELDGIVEGPDGRTALDNSLLMLGSDLGEGDGHAAEDLCFLIAGGSGPGRRGYHFDGSGENVNRLLNTVLRMACVTDSNGAPIEDFGLPGFAPGTISELLT